MDYFSAGAAVAKVGHYIFKNQKPIINTISRYLKSALGKDEFIPIFGCGGVGKTTCAKLLMGDNPFDLAALYAESPDTEKIPLKGNIPGEMVIAAGQGRRIREQWGDIYESIVKRQPKIIINVVAYGYHDFAIDNYKDHDSYESGMTIAAFMKRYSEHNRQKELAALFELKNGLSAHKPKQKLIILTLINKQDLWYNQQHEVKNHYQNGDYEKIVNELRVRFGENNFEHILMPISFTLNNLCSKEGKIMAKTVSGYDFKVNAIYTQRLFDVMGKYLGVVK